MALFPPVKYPTQKNQKIQDPTDYKDLQTDLQRSTNRSTCRLQRSERTTAERTVVEAGLSPMSLPAIAARRRRGGLHADKATCLLTAADGVRRGRGGTAAWSERRATVVGEEEATPQHGRRERDGVASTLGEGGGAASRGRRTVADGRTPTPEEKHGLGEAAA
jgi:hypothetical protein